MTIETNSQGIPPIGQPASLTDRVKRIITQPKVEWELIAAEPATVKGIYTGYVMILAAIPVLAGLIGGQIFGYSTLGVTYRPTLADALQSAIISYAGALVGIFLIALVIDWLAPRFGGESNRIQALKVSAYSATATWLAGVFALIPSLGFLNILGLYSLYLIYTGLPRLMKAPEDKAMSYVIVTILAVFVLALVLAFFMAPFLVG
ncbi:Yip1 family protein [Allosphingosinicella vermicomposti]|uniref:Yip1 family protein n=1 Tax=Allosphingosinicella vermicomposti TaxID=614671 RepID=UPI000D10C2E1|nr:Yip1 family protein [Allosphingosinicella vermicomposti]